VEAARVVSGTSEVGFAAAPPRHHGPSAPRPQHARRGGRGSEAELFRHEKIECDPGGEGVRWLCPWLVEYLGFQFAELVWSTDCAEISRGSIRGCRPVGVA